MNLEEALQIAVEADSVESRLDGLNLVHETACQKTGFPLFTIQHELSPFKALSFIGKSLFFRDLETLRSSRTKKAKIQSLCQSIQLMEDCSDLRNRLPAQATYDATIKRFYQEDGYFLNSGEIRSRYAKMFRPLEGNVPEALAEVYASATGAFECALKELAEVEEFEALGETEEDDFPPLPEKSELQYHAAKAVANAETARYIADIRRQTRR